MFTDLRNLPADVVRRLPDDLKAPPDTYRRNFDAVSRGRVVEARSSTLKTERRKAENGDPIIDGYATVYEYPYDVCGGPSAYGWTETIAEGAAGKTIRERDDVRLLVDHEGVPLARTRSKTLMLSSDSIGVRCETPGGIDMRSPLVQTIASAMERDDLDEMSIAFRVLRQEWNDDYTERRILELMLFDVSVVTYPANPAAVALLRAEPPTDFVGLDLATASRIADSLRLRAAR